MPLAGQGTRPLLTRLDIRLPCRSAMRKALGLQRLPGPFALDIVSGLRPAIFTAVLRPARAKCRPSRLLPDEPERHDRVLRRSAMAAAPS